MTTKFPLRDGETYCLTSLLQALCEAQPDHRPFYTVEYSYDYKDRSGDQTVKVVYGDVSHCVAHIDESINGIGRIKPQETIIELDYDAKERTLTLDLSDERLGYRPYYKFTMYSNNVDIFVSYREDLISRWERRHRRYDLKDGLCRCPFTDDDDKVHGWKDEHPIPPSASIVRLANILHDVILGKPEAASWCHRADDKTDNYL